MSQFVACIEKGSGFSTYRDFLAETTLPKLLKAIKQYADVADENDYLCILGSTQEPDAWEQIEDCWETYVVPAIDKRVLVKKIKLVEDNIAKEETWFAELESIKAFKLNYLELQRSVLKTLKEQQ